MKEDLSLEMLNREDELNRLCKEYNTKLNHTMIMSNFDITERVCSYMYLLQNTQQQGLDSLVKIQPTVNTMLDQLKESREEYAQLNAKPDHIQRLISDPIDVRSRLGLEKQGQNTFYFILLNELIITKKV